MRIPRRPSVMISPDWAANIGAGTVRDRRGWPVLPAYTSHSQHRTTPARSQETTTPTSTHNEAQTPPLRKYFRDLLEPSRRVPLEAAETPQQKNAGKKRGRPAKYVPNWLLSEHKAFIAGSPMASEKDFCRRLGIPERTWRYIKKKNEGAA